MYILDPGLFLRYSQYKLAPTRQIRPGGGQGTHKAIQPRCHPGFLPPRRTVADLDIFFPPSLSTRIHFIDLLGIKKRHLGIKKKLGDLLGISDPKV